MAELQWSIYRADLDPLRGSEQAGNRPVLIVTREALNRSLPVIGVCPLTSLKPGRRIYSTEVLVRAGVGGTTSDSLIMAHQFRTISKDRLSARMGQISGPDVQAAVRHALAIYLDLS